MIDYSWHQQLQENASTNAAAAAASLYFSDILLPNILRVTNLDNWIFGEICTFYIFDDVIKDDSGIFDNKNSI